MQTNNLEELLERSLLTRDSRLRLTVYAASRSLTSPPPPSHDVTKLLATPLLRTYSLPPLPFALLNVELAIDTVPAAFTLPALLLLLPRCAVFITQRGYEENTNIVIPLRCLLRCILNRPRRSYFHFIFTGDNMVI